MAIKDRKITEASIAKHGVSAAPDRMTGTAAENKKVFDNLVRAVVAEQVNGLVDDLLSVQEGASGAGEIGVSPVSGLDGDNVQTVLTALGNKLERRIAEAGVASFNGRSGAVLPQSGDYTAAMVGAAPSGYGYGENISFIVWDDADGSKLAAYIDSFAEEGVNKVLRFTTMVDYPACKVAGAGGCADAFLNGTNNAVIVFYGAGDSNYGYGCAIRKKGGGVWHEWEYVNPPMLVGVEYRTTERWGGKPVYVKKVDVGPLPAKGNYLNVSNEIFSSDANAFFRTEVWLTDFGCPLPLANVDGNRVWFSNTGVLAIYNHSTNGLEPKDYAKTHVTRWYTKRTD